MKLYNQRNMLDQNIQSQTEEILRQILFDFEHPEELK